jgi:hypothetical protein
MSGGLSGNVENKTIRLTFIHTHLSWKQLVVVFVTEQMFLLASLSSPEKCSFGSRKEHSLVLRIYAK